MTNFLRAVPEEDLIRAANAIWRREATECWASGEGQKLLELLMDEQLFEKAGHQFKMPDKLWSSLETVVLPRILQVGEGEGVCWSVQDPTVVMYGEGEGQVPHDDPCNAMILVYLSGAREDDDSGVGDTCLPILGYRVSPVLGQALLIFSSVCPQGPLADVSSAEHFFL